MILKICSNCKGTDFNISCDGQNIICQDCGEVLNSTKCTNCGSIHLYPSRQNLHLSCRDCRRVAAEDTAIAKWQQLNFESSLALDKLDTIQLHPSIDDIEKYQAILFQKGCTILKFTDHESWAGQGVLIAVPDCLKNDERINEIRKEVE